MKPPAPKSIALLLFVIVGASLLCSQPAAPIAMPPEKPGRFQAIAVTVTPNEENKRAFATALRLDTATGEASILVSMDVGVRTPTVRAHGWVPVGENLAKQVEAASLGWKQLHEANQK